MTMGPIKFKSMTIDREMYGDQKGKLKAKVRCDSWNTQLEVTLPEETVTEMMKLIAPTVAAQVQIALTDVARDHELVLLAGTETVEADANA